MSENKNINNETIEDLDNDFLDLGLDSSNELDFDLIEDYLSKSEDKQKPSSENHYSKPSFLDGATASIKPHVPQEKQMPNIAPDKKSEFLSSESLLRQLRGESKKEEKVEPIISLEKNKEQEVVSGFFDDIETKDSNSSQNFGISDDFFKENLQDIKQKEEEIVIKKAEEPEVIISNPIVTLAEKPKSLGDNYIISQFQEDDLNAFKISSLSDSIKLEGAIKDTIHISVGVSTYGWNVSFSNGVVMSLNDMRTYQSRNKKILDSSGKITYGSKVFEFSDIRKITFYENPKYFSYTKLK